MIDEQQLFIPGLILGLNDVLEAKGLTFGRGRNRGQNAYNALKIRVERTIAFHVKRSKLQPMPQVFVLFTYLESSRRRDKDNIASVVRKFAFDTLVTQQIIPNDGWGQIVGWYDTFEVNPAHPGILMHLLDPAKKAEKIAWLVQQAVATQLTPWRTHT